ncbi:secretin N-terminal domain-containing protein [Pseudoalteromonas sp. APC 3224]|uniref:secretin N-terminal domain-containing protein n=1 Tax=Pseudoalteromonas sp. APC 3224 TaxID=3035203 RepID=UPI0025B30317|nr:secretin N-terminal domain-containing protein [Pseudoalteromonas sp. APC 3224]MDN3484897.1 secretin N-terminal domain-containing protein [Pseudoalteromonas sp. APC 3224]
MKHSKILILGLLASGVLAGCSTTHNGLSPTPSYLQKNTTVSVKANEEPQSTNPDNNKTAAQHGITYLEPLANNKTSQSEQANLADQFSNTERVKLTADSLLVKDYLHYVFGELLNVNYILGEQLNNSKDKVTLNLQDELTKRKLFTLSEQILRERNILIRYQDGIYYIHKSDDGVSSNLVYGYGANPEDVPNTSNEIVQLAPFKAGMQTSLANTIKQLTKVDARPMFDQQAIMFKGKRSDIIKALEFMQLVDRPLFRNRSIGMYKSTFIQVEELSKQLQDLMKQEGISVSINASSEQAVSIVPIERTNTMVFFTNDKRFIQRTLYWAKQLDQPADGNQEQYFVFNPEFSRATDLGESLQMLLGGGASKALTSSTSATSQNNQVNSNNSNKVKRNISVNADGMKMVVDERSNALIFYTTGDDYRNLLPMIKRLDIMPKQIVLEMMIAEVTLTDEFKQGVEFALTNQGASKQGGFNLENGGSGLSYVLSGTAGKLEFNLLQKDTYVNVLSRPSLAVRDGVQASITVGNRIPIVGDIITDPVNGSRTSVEYLETGIDLQVTPTVNAQGVVLMEITQKISNQASSSGAEGNPIIFERSLKTEVIAGNGQTIMLGGLISENSTLSDRSVPFFSSIPIFGRLFDGTDNNTNKTELVVLVTPRIVDSTAEWESVYSQFKQGMSELKLSDVEEK